ncbi:MAG: peptidoglycan DD-metalloendopeptidase family protein [Dysgonomonas sp.]|nr:peptidoglycan DD-metalloendopeptidase family protein [Dysgonomonas sp.]
MRSVLVVFLLFALGFSAFSQTNKKIKELERKRKLAIQEIENTTLLLKESKKSTANLLNRINLITEQISSRQNLISLLNQEVTALTEQQTITEKEIVKLEADLKVQQQAYGKAVEGIVLKKQNTNKLVFVLSGKSLGESLRRMKYLRDYSEWRNEQIVGIREKQKELQEKKASLEKSKKDKVILLNSRQKEQANLQNEEKTHKQEVQEANKKQSELQTLLQKKQKQADNLNVQIERLIAEEVARQEREAKRLATEKARKDKERRERERKEAERRARANKPGTTSKPTTTTKPKVEDAEVETERMNDAPPVTKENFKLSSNFASNKGRLPMPITGRYRIIGRFGTHQHNRWNVKTNSSGIDIQAQSGAQARSVFDGEVSRIVAFPGYNNCIIVRHGGYYTFYGNIQQVTVRQGQKVSAGQSLGSIYTDSDTGSSQLHFQLWKGTTKLNPEPWLKK